MAMASAQLVQTLIEIFNALACEVQHLVDRKTILEHKLRFAHEQYQLLADKYAPAAPHIADTLAKLQLPPRPSPIPSNNVPLPRRHQSGSSQAELALFVRKGKKVAQLLADEAKASKASKASRSSRDTFSTNMTSQSTVLEKDFTVQGKQGHLRCPFSAATKRDQDEDAPTQPGDAAAREHPDPDPDPDDPIDPICAAMMPETMPAAAAPNASAAKCPIRYLDKHSPEEIARYVETHKHELPRSHEVCLRRNQKNEEQIRKLDAKYGNLVSMIQDLSHLHAPMLPGADRAAITADVDRASNRRVSDWAHNVSASAVNGQVNGQVDGLVNAASGDGLVPTAEEYLDRTSHFDRPLKDVRLGESPTRPWGISVPVPLHPPPQDRAASPPAAGPLDTLSPEAGDETVCTTTAARPSRCPFDHSKMMQLNHSGLSQCPNMDDQRRRPPSPSPRPAPSQPDTFPIKHQPESLGANVDGRRTHQPANALAPCKEETAGPHVVFNGPVFIGYPMEQAVQFMQSLQGQSH